MWQINNTLHGQQVECDPTNEELCQKNNCLASCRHNKEGTRVNAQFWQQSLRYLPLLTSTRLKRVALGRARARLDPRTSETRCKQGAHDHPRDRVGEKQASGCHCTARKSKTGKELLSNRGFILMTVNQRDVGVSWPSLLAARVNLILSQALSKNYDERKQGGKTERGTVSSLENMY